MGTLKNDALPQSDKGSQEKAVNKAIEELPKDVDRDKQKMKTDAHLDAMAKLITWIIAIAGGLMASLILFFEGRLIWMWLTR